MATLRPVRFATPPAARSVPSSARLASLACLALALTIGAALLVPACGKDSNLGALCPTDPLRAQNSPAMTAMEFCQLYVQTCTGANSPPNNYATEAECERAYDAFMFETTRECRSYHLCNSAAYDPKNVALHCRHSIGLDMCADTAVGP
jgi:hypothetical protein